MRKMLALGILIASSACGGGGSSPSAPIAVPTPVPTPPPLLFTFTPQAPPPPPNFVMWLFGTKVGITDPREGAVVINASELRNVCKVRGTLRWDPRVLQATGWGEGGWFAQGGALVDWTHFFHDGDVDLFLDRPSSQGCVSGSGPIFFVYFKPRGTLPAGATQLQWDGPNVYDANFRGQRLDNAFGGELKFQ